MGLEALRSLLTSTPWTPAFDLEPIVLPVCSSLADLIDELSAPNQGLDNGHGQRRASGRQLLPPRWPCHWPIGGLPVHLTTTDPAQHVRETLKAEVEEPARQLHRSQAGDRNYRQRMLDSARKTLSDEKIALLEEELKSPCYEEVAVFQAFSRLVIGAREELVVIDTARPATPSYCWTPPVLITVK